MNDSKIMDVLRSRYNAYTWWKVSDKDTRSVYKLAHDTLPSMFVKVYYHPFTLFQRLRNRLCPRMLQEARMLKDLKGAGIRVPEVIDQVQAGDQSALITSAIEPSTPLETVPRENQARILLKTAALLLERGFVHKDLHAGTIILDMDNKSVLVDGYAVSPRRRITRKDVISLFGMVVSHYEITDEQLIEHVPFKDQIDLALIFAIRNRAHKINRARVKRLVWLSLRPGSFSEFIRTPEYTAIVRRGTAIDLDGVIAVHRSNIKHRQNLLKCQEKTQVSLVGPWCVKSYRKARPFTTPYAIRAWKGGLTLSCNGISVPEPVACVLFEDRSNLIVIHFLDLLTLDKILYHDYTSFPPSKRHDIPEKLGELIGRMHALGIYHADLKACNILTDKDGIRFFLTDTDRVRQYRYLSEKRRIKNLLQIHLSIPKHVSRPFRMRFLKGYTGETREDTKVLFSKIWGLSKGMEIVYTTDMGDKFERWDQESPQYPGRDQDG